MIELGDKDKVGFCAATQTALESRVNGRVPAREKNLSLVGIVSFPASGGSFLSALASCVVRLGLWGRYQWRKKDLI